MPKATAVANANIALVKYWGKRNSEFILPYNSSISMTCAGMQTKTTVEFSPEYKEDIVIINQEKLKKDEKDIAGHLERIRKIAGITEKAKVVSDTNFPVAAGLASSASGLAALTLAASKSAGLNLEPKELSILARMGSGSACRSIFGGFVEWKRGERDDGTDSYAEVVAGENHWPEFRIIATIVSTKEKPVGSRSGMSQTVKTCPYYKSWIESVEEDLENVRKGILERDFKLVGETAEYNCLKMHATMITTKPPIIYWLPETMEIIHWVRSVRETGVDCYFTIDAGPQVKIICLEKDANSLKKELESMECVIKSIECKPGSGAELINNHLF